MGFTAALCIKATASKMFYVIYWSIAQTVRIRLYHSTLYSNFWTLVYLWHSETSKVLWKTSAGTFEYSFQTFYETYRYNFYFHSHCMVENWKAAAQCLFLCKLSPHVLLVFLCCKYYSISGECRVSCLRRQSLLRLFKHCTIQFRVCKKAGFYARLYFWPLFRSSNCFENSNISQPLRSVLFLY